MIYQLDACNAKKFVDQSFVPRSIQQAVKNINMLDDHFVSSSDPDSDAD